MSIAAWKAATSAEQKKESRKRRKEAMAIMEEIAAHRAVRESAPERPPGSSLAQREHASGGHVRMRKKLLKAVQGLGLNCAYVPESKRGPGTPGQGNHGRCVSCGVVVKAWCGKYAVWLDGKQPRLCCGARCLLSESGRLLERAYPRLGPKTQDETQPTAQAAATPLSASCEATEGKE